MNSKEEKKSGVYHKVFWYIEDFYFLTKKAHELHFKIHFSLVSSQQSPYGYVQYIGKK